VKFDIGGIVFDFLVRLLLSDSHEAREGKLSEGTFVLKRYSCVASVRETVIDPD